MRALIKIGGTLLDEEASRRKIAAELAAVARQNELVVVHGGGKQVTRFLDRQGIASQFVGGLRVSDEQVVDAVTKVIAGSVNTQLVSALIASGRPAVGLSGVDGSLTVARPLDPALGFVGQPVETRGSLLALLAGAGYLPVVACLAGDKEGRIYNVNADQMAVSCALAWRAEKLIFLTDVAGVRDAAGQVLPQLAGDEIAELVRAGVAQGGMQAKLEAARLALAGGVPEVVIAAGAEPHICRRVMEGEHVGTVVSRAGAVAAREATR